MVILECFLTMKWKLEEGDLDLERIKRVRNSNFARKNVEFKFYNYMIIQSESINDLTPPGLDHTKF